MKLPLLVFFLAILTSCASLRPAGPALVQGSTVPIQELQATLPAGAVKFDLYLPAAARSAPLVVVAHGFLRTKANMAGWGKMLAAEGFVVAVPTLPTLSDHPRNARAIGELTQWLCATLPYRDHIDAGRIGFMGFSAGGLSTLLAATDDPKVKIWVGLDPVDRDGLGLAAVPRLHAQCAILRAEPSPWNAQGNSRTLIEALGPRCQTFLIPGAIHIDAEWPTDAMAELACGKSSDQCRSDFVSHALAALKASLLSPAH